MGYRVYQGLKLFLLVFVLVSALVFGLIMASESAYAQTVGKPLEYSISATINYQQRSVLGSVELSIPATYAAGERCLYLDLPMNRFRAEGDANLYYPASGTIFPEFIIRESVDVQDPLLPSDFEGGSITIQSFHDNNGQPIDYELLANTTLDAAYWQQDTLLKFCRPVEQDWSIMLTFSIELPRRYIDGWNDWGIFLDRWYPAALAYEDGNWIFEASPEPASINLTVSTADQGWLVAAFNNPELAEANTQYSFMADRVSSMPLLYLTDDYQELESATDQTIIIKQDLEEDRDALAFKIAQEGLQFYAETFDFPPLTAPLLLIESPMQRGNMIVLGSLIILPQVHWNMGSLLDRLFAMRLIKSIGEVYSNTYLAYLGYDARWFSNLGGFATLEWFEEAYGEEAGLNPWFDWLNPSFRQHILEKLLSNDSNKRYNLLGQSGQSVSQRIYNDHESPLLLRNIYHSVGSEAYLKTLRQLIAADEKIYNQDLIAQLNKDIEADLAQHVQRSLVRQDLDYSILEWNSAEEQQGYTTTITIGIKPLDAPRIPLEIELSCADDSTKVLTWNPAIRQPDALNEEANQAEFTAQFSTDCEVASIVLDPNEYFMENNRLNNYSSTKIRIRPLVGLSKRSEILTSIAFRFGGNAVDGNIFGAGLRIATPGANQELLIMPYYGQNTGYKLFDINYSHNNLPVPGWFMRFGASRLGGTDRYQIALGTGINPARFWNINTELNLSAYYINSYLKYNKKSWYSTLNYSIAVSMSSRRYFVEQYLNIQAALPQLSANTFAKLYTYHEQRLHLNNWNLIGAKMIYQGSDKATPAQFLAGLGGPLALRGYPRTTNLVFNQMLLGQFDYRLVLTRSGFGGTLRVNRVSLLLTYDVGRGWADSFSHAPTRHSVGAGLQIDLSFIDLFFAPIRFLVAVPLNDSQYIKPVYTIFNTVSFF